MNNKNRFFKLDLGLVSHLLQKDRAQNSTEDDEHSNYSIRAKSELNRCVELFRSRPEEYSNRNIFHCTKLTNKLKKFSSLFERMKHRGPPQFKHYYILNFLNYNAIFRKRRVRKF